ncbi:FMN-dependent NADH-azoreductase [Ideonella sp. BN130291]|uniref:FMN-dependent NADH-azoreductase n=1 Tax=Ideonella sp. BN130291 TaxID=3112940 RepID=UPI002E274352|nr:NAD(P)H-dependent oxidoreductase [Ideonella sp. BN130291]
MSTLLYVAASPAKEASRSGQAAEALVQAYRDRHPGAVIDRLNVWDETLPPFDAEMIAAKFAVLRRTQATDAQRRLWGQAVALAQRFNAADRYVFSVPMWNFGLPYRLKHFIDVVTLPEQNWRWSPAGGYQGLLHGKRAVVVYSSAGDHRLAPHESEVDHQKGQMRAWLAFIGIHDVQELTVAPTLAAPDVVSAALAAAVERARGLAAGF